MDTKNLALYLKLSLIDTKKAKQIDSSNRTEENIATKVAKPNPAADILLCQEQKGRKYGFEVRGTRYCTMSSCGFNQSRVCYKK